MPYYEAADDPPVYPIQQGRYEVPRG